MIAPSVLPGQGAVHVWRQAQGRRISLECPFMSNYRHSIAPHRRFRAWQKSTGSSGSASTMVRTQGSRYANTILRLVKNHEYTPCSRWGSSRRSRLFLRSHMYMSPLQWLCLPCTSPICRFAHEHVHNSQPLPLRVGGLRLGRQSAREAASPVGAGAMVRCRAEETVHPNVSLPLQRFEADCRSSHRGNFPTHQARLLTTGKPEGPYR